MLSQPVLFLITWLLCDLPAKWSECINTIYQYSGIVANRPHVAVPVQWQLEFRQCWLWNLVCQGWTGLDWSIPPAVRITSHTTPQIKVSQCGRDHTQEKAWIASFILPAQMWALSELSTSTCSTLVYPPKTTAMQQTCGSMQTLEF